MQNNITYHSGKFKHDFLPEFNLERQDTPSGRFYVTPAGDRYPSVTTWLGSFDDGSLDAWRNAVGEKEANRISTRAANRGTLMHENIEVYLRNGTVAIPRADFLTTSMFRGIQNHLNDIDNIRCLETKLYSDDLKLAGTVDCIGDYKGTLSLIDFKSSTHTKDLYQIDGYWLQTTIYALMAAERYGLNIKQLVIMMAVEFSPPLVFIDTVKNWIPELVRMQKEYRLKSMS